MEALGIVDTTSAVMGQSKFDITTAAFCNQLEVIKDLLDNGKVDVNTVNFEGSTSLIIAAENNFEILARHLLFYNADFSICNEVKHCFTLLYFTLLSLNSVHSALLCFRSLYSILRYP